MVHDAVLAHSPGGRSRRAQTTRPPPVVVIHAPAVRAGEGFHQVQAVRAAVRRPAMPGAAEVFGLDPHVISVQFGADGEERAPAGGVDDGVGGQFGHDEDRLVGGRAAR